MEKEIDKSCKRGTITPADKSCPGGRSFFNYGCTYGIQRETFSLFSGRHG